ncbi:MAG: hypothetical protein ACM3ST_17870 [Bdellovibrio bacteriovorus]
MNLDEREQGLLRLVEAYWESECRSLFEAARQEAAELIGRTYQQERARLHQRVLAERAGARERIQAARAERDTRERAGRERANARILAVAWPRIETALAARWHDSEGRQAWVQGVLEQARQLLPHGVWTLRHAPDWPEHEWQALGSLLAAQIGSEPRFVADGAISAGLAIEGAGAVLDGSLEGLLKDRTRIESRLLALLQEVPRS